MHICIRVPISVTKNLRFTSGLERPFIDILSVGLGDIGSGQIGSSQQTFLGCGDEIPFEDGDLREDFIKRNEAVYIRYTKPYKKNDPVMDRSVAQSNVPRSSQNTIYVDIQKTPY